MKIVSIIGSPRVNGNTYRMVSLIEKKLSELDANIEFENIQLSTIDFNTCKGCHVCLSKGEVKCPLKDDRESLEEKINLL